MDHELHDRRERALHPFAEDPWRRRRTAGTTAIALVVTMLATFGVIALVVFT